jgi:hypothetical protein
MVSSDRPGLEVRAESASRLKADSIKVDFGGLSNQLQSVGNGLRLLARTSSPGLFRFGFPGCLCCFCRCGLLGSGTFLPAASELLGLGQ